MGKVGWKINETCAINSDNVNAVNLDLNILEYDQLENVQLIKNTTNYINTLIK
jgi:hypothetical protein